MTLSSKTENSKVKSHVVRVGLRWMLNFSTGGKKRQGVGVSTKLLNKTTSCVDTVNHIHHITRLEEIALYSQQY